MQRKREKDPLSSQEQGILDKVEHLLNLYSERNLLFEDLFFVKKGPISKTETENAPENEKTQQSTINPVSIIKENEDRRPINEAEILVEERSNSLPQFPVQRDDLPPELPEQREESWTEPVQPNGVEPNQVLSGKNRLSDIKKTNDLEPPEERIIKEILEKEIPSDRGFQNNESKISDFSETALNKKESRSEPLSALAIHLARMFSEESEWKIPGAEKKVMNLEQSLTEDESFLSREDLYKAEEDLAFCRKELETMNQTLVSITRLFEEEKDEPVQIIFE